MGATILRILIAEDDSKLLKSLIYIFETNNYVVDGVNNGEDAFDYALTGEYDALVLDIMRNIHFFKKLLTNSKNLL